MTAAVTSRKSDTLSFGCQSATGTYQLRLAWLLAFMAFVCSRTV